MDTAYENQNPNSKWSIPMNICKPLFTIIVASALSSLAPQVIADDGQGRDNGHSQGHKHVQNDCRAKITSTTISFENKEPAWIISGDCLENVTHVYLAMDEGAGFEDLTNTFTWIESGSSDAKTSLSIPIVARSSGIGGFLIGKHALSVGQYLLQVKSCQIGEDVKKCKIDDETPVPAIGDQDTIDALIANGPSIAALLKNAPSMLAALDNIPSISATLELIKHKLGL